MRATKAMMSLNYTMEDVVTAWRRSSRIVSFTAGRIKLQNDVVNVTAVASQKNVAREESIKFQTDYAILKNSMVLVSQSNAVDITTEKMKTFGSQSNLVVILRETADEKSSEKKTRQVVEIWKNGSLHNSLDLQMLDLHGKVYTDARFGCWELSPDEKHLVYLAEKKQPKKQTFLQCGIVPVPEGAKVGAEYEYTEDWGEQLVGKSQPVICIYDMEWEPYASPNPVKILDSDDQWSPGQMIWCTNDQLAGVAWYHQPRRLGLMFCTNRPSRLFKVNISSGQYEWFGSNEETAASPRHHSGNVVYLKCLAYGPHHKEQKIVLVNQKGEVQQTNAETGPKYRGMYNDSFPKRCWSPDGKVIVFSSPCKSSIKSFALNLDSSKIFQIPLPNGCTGGAVLDVLEDLILLCGVSLTCPDKLYIGRLDWGDLDKSISWTQLSSNNDLPTDSLLASDTLSFDTPDGMEFEATLIYPKKAVEKTPLIVSPHGGPHSVSTDQFKSEAYFFSLLGYATLLVNYRGSTGFGEKALHSLLGKIGVQDVQECHEATLSVLKKHTFLDKDQVVLFGGSHGGFLVTHLSGQYPDFYRSVSARNPVIDIATMYPITDIADWSIVESFSSDGRELENILNPRTLATMYECSPIKYAAQVKAPTLLLVGKVDLRVPPTQSMEYYRVLRLNGKKAKVLMYDDCHPLSLLPVDANALINTALWFKESLEENIL